MSFSEKVFWFFSGPKFSIFHFSKKMNYNEIKKEIVDQLFEFSKGRFNKSDFEIALIATLKNEKMDLR
jgi:hypothetical protein